jgi:hypothetical protein
MRKEASSSPAPGWRPAAGTATREGRRRCSPPLENVKTTPAIDQVEEPARIDTDVVAAHACLALWHRRHERGHLARGMGICDVDDPKPVSKPCHRNFRPPHVRAGLMVAGERRLRRTIDTGHLETCKGHGACLVRDVDRPEERGWARGKLRHVLVGDEENAPAAKRTGNAVCVGDRRKTRLSRRGTVGAETCPRRQRRLTPTVVRLAVRASWPPLLMPDGSKSKMKAPPPGEAVSRRTIAVNPPNGFVGETGEVKESIGSDGQERACSCRSVRS